MAYSNFNSLKIVKKQLGLSVAGKPLFGEIAPVQPGEWLLQTLKINLHQRVGLFSEKARSEAIVFPVLMELKSRHGDDFTVYSGAILDADKEKGLNGECDFILGLGKQNIELEAPIFCIVEAKDNDLELGIPQCAAQMVGARMYNQQDGLDLPRMFGCVTTGVDWVFLRLEDSELQIDDRQFSLGNLPELLGALETVLKSQI